MNSDHSIVFGKLTSPKHVSLVHADDPPVTFFDTCMVSLAALIVWRLPPYVVFLPWLTIACLDGLYMSSALTKVPDGAWFTLTLAGVLASFLILWRFGKEQQWAAEAQDRFPTTHLVQKDSEGWIKLTRRYGGDPLSVIKGFGKKICLRIVYFVVVMLRRFQGIFFDKAGETTPAVFTHFLSKLVAAPEVSAHMIVFYTRAVLRKP